MARLVLQIAVVALVTIMAHAQVVPGTFSCANGRYIPLRYRCDYDDDCRDGSDEVGCTTCTARNFLCQQMKKCIPRTYICDGDNDCGDDSDETGCTSCTRGNFLCRNVGKCIKHAQECDGKNDCGDNSDETNCKSGNIVSSNQDDGWNWGYNQGYQVPVTAAPAYRPRPPVPRQNTFQCDNRRTIDLSAKCDGYDDCGDNSDEYDCEY